MQKDALNNVHITDEHIQSQLPDREWSKDHIPPAGADRDRR